MCFGQNPCLSACEGEEDFKKWSKSTKGRHRNVCFDVHCYHCASAVVTTLSVRTAALHSKVSRTSSMGRLLRSSYEPWRRVVSDAKRGGSPSAVGVFRFGGQHRDVQAASHGCRPGRPKAQKPSDSESCEGSGPWVSAKPPGAPVAIWMRPGRMVRGRLWCYFVLRWFGPVDS